ncbi:hypothetical protein DB88DRAFT_473632 [Papiliotrema laurentii]|uniref:Uncharacterized protein n=1 Tax=Papiliotrema laurentii TaxID=5418 RepID=A0AAD9CWN5_PAPLA|nr:hypothetical protein DB88DRAFT_473632 [Papiliotrema laurentii]
MNIFDGPLQPICWDKRGNRVNADSPSVHTVLDPAQDGWDALWGPLPQIGLEAATTVMAWTRQEDVDLIKMWMMRRRQLVPHRDGKRKFSKFEENTATKGGLKLTPQRLLIGWFADTYTSNSNSAKMVVDHTFVNLQNELGIVSSILQWLQYIGRLLWHQRIFSTGVTLAGLRLRFALPVRYLSGNARTGLSRYRFDAEFQVFMWDTQKGKDMTQEMVSLVNEWREDLLTGIEAMKHCAVQIQQEFWKLGADVLDLSQVAVKRRISFRPGFSPLKVDDSKHVGKFMSSWFNSHNKHPSPKVLHLPEMYWQATGDFLALDALGSFMELYKVNEAILLNQRQFQWDQKSLNAINSELGLWQLSAALYLMSKSLHVNRHGGTTPNAHTIQKLDFGNLVLLIKTHDGQSSKFFPLSDFKALQTIVLPYIKKQTAEIILNPMYGLQQQVLSRPIFLETGKQVQGYLTIQVKCDKASTCTAFRQEMLKKIWSEGENLIITSNSLQDPAMMRTARATARQAVNAWAARIMVVDQSKARPDVALKDDRSAQPIQNHPFTNWPPAFCD